MIELLRYSKSRGADILEERLKSMSAAYKRTVVDRLSELDSGGIFPENGKSTRLPAIRENGKIISDPEKIDAFINQLEADIKKWNRFTGDYCFLDDDGNIC
ncbi:MAG: hypothetical protein ACNA8K_06910 [Cyclonatronaceae bacterium]